jgi:hypothetical protein
VKDDSQLIGQKGQTEKKKRGAGSFRITMEAFQILIENKASAWQIGAYLCLARHTEKTGKFSTAGYKKIYESTGASPGSEKQPGVARRLVKELMELSCVSDNGICKLLYAPQEWQEMTGEPIPETANKLYPISFVLNDFDSGDWIWMANELVDGYGRFKHPLKRLKQCGDVAGRLLLIAYCGNNMEEFGGVQPQNFFYKSYRFYEHKLTAHGFTFNIFNEDRKVVSGRVFQQAFGSSLSKVKREREFQSNQIMNALASLESQGFIYEITTVVDAPPDTDDSRPIYELHNKSYNQNKGEEGLVRRIDRILAIAKASMTDKQYFIADTVGRYSKTFPVISRVGVIPDVVGIYRLRFRINNPKNYPVRAAWKRICDDRREWENELVFLEKIFGIVQAKTESKTTELTLPLSQEFSPELREVPHEVSALLRGMDAHNGQETDMEQEYNDVEFYDE